MFTPRPPPLPTIASLLVLRSIQAVNTPDQRHLTNPHHSHLFTEAGSQEATSRGLFIRTGDAHLGSHIYCKTIFVARWHFQLCNHWCAQLLSILQLKLQRIQFLCCRACIWGVIHLFNVVHQFDCKWILKAKCTVLNFEDNDPQAT